MGIPYTGPGVMASSIAMDKIMTKRLWRADGLPTPDWRLVASPEDTVLALQALGSPMIVKPAREGSTLGLTKVATPEECAEAYALASRYDPEVLCEQFIDGDETTCPILGAGAGAHALPVIRIVAPQGNYDYQNKYFTDDTQYRKPFLLEINTSPGMTGHSLVPMSARAAGLSYEDLCLHLLGHATLDSPLGARHAADGVPA